MFMNCFDQFCQYIIVVVDIGDFDQFVVFCLQDVMMNFFFVLKVVQLLCYLLLLWCVVVDYFGVSLMVVVEYLFVVFGVEIFRFVFGCVFIEIDLCLFYDIVVFIVMVWWLIVFYVDVGVLCECVFVKLVLIWEGIQVVCELERQGICINFMLLFCLVQVCVCVDVGVWLILFFVGCIYDWFKKIVGYSWDDVVMVGFNDFGVCLVVEIYCYYKCYGICIEVMVVSFCNIGQIFVLVGCDLMIISFVLLVEFIQLMMLVQVCLLVFVGEFEFVLFVFICEQFDVVFVVDVMVCDKFVEGIVQFIIDIEVLEQLICVY